MKKEPLISVIVPVYNVEQYLEKCVNSIINQTYKNLEIILVDDGSPDNCPKICDDFAKKDNRIKVIHKKNGGLMQAWIDGFKSSSGDFISFVDSDDWVELTFIEDLISPIIKDSSIDLTICNYYKATDKKKYLLFASKNNIYGTLEGDQFDNLKKTYLRTFPYYRWNKLFKRNLIENNLQFCDNRISLCEDVCITASSILDSKKIFIVNNHLYNYYVRNTSIINSYNPKLLANFEIFHDMFVKVLNEKKYNTYENFSQHLIYLMFMLTKNIISSNAKHKKKLMNELYSSNLYKEFEKCDTKSLGVVYKVFSKFLKSKKIFLLKTIIKLNDLLHK